MEFRDWPFKRIALLSAGWILTLLVLLAVLVSRSLSAVETSGAGAFSIGLLDSALLLVGPPLLLWFFWLVLRRPTIHHAGE